MFRLHLEIALEDAHILASHAKQSFHGFIRNVIVQVARRDRILELAQVDVLIVPIAQNGLIDLPKDGTIFGIDFEL